jgi:1,4-dihydroxy-6-naphthoate synthase
VLVARQFKLPKAAREPADQFVSAREWLRGKTIAVPGKRTSALLALRLFGSGLPSQFHLDYKTVVVPFDQILQKVAAGEYDAGLIIHEGQLTYHKASSGGLKKVVDLGAWWTALTGLPLPLGGNAIRRDLGRARIRRISKHLHESIKWGLEHRKEALSHALKYGRGIGRAKADKFVGMYVNAYTLDYGAKGRAAVRLFLDAGRRLGIIPGHVVPEWSR